MHVAYPHGAPEQLQESFFLIKGSQLQDGVAFHRMKGWRFTVDKPDQGVAFHRG